MLLNLSTAVSVLVLVVLIIREIRLRLCHTSTVVDGIGEVRQSPDPADPLS